MAPEKRPSEDELKRGRTKRLTRSQTNILSPTDTMTANGTPNESTKASTMSHSSTTPELKGTAIPVSTPDSFEGEELLTESQILRWEKLFGYNRQQIISLINEHRLYKGHAPIPDAHWQTIRKEEEEKGHDRETYEVSFLRLKLGNQLTGISTPYILPKS